MKHEVNTNKNLNIAYIATKTSGRYTKYLGNDAEELSTWLNDVTTFSERAPRGLLLLINSPISDFHKGRAAQ